jgi:hypothetical protein
LLLSRKPSLHILAAEISFGMSMILAAEISFGMSMLPLSMPVCSKNSLV